MKTLNDIFSTEESFLDEEIILDFGEHVYPKIVTAPRPWTEYERIEVGVRQVNERANSLDGVAIADKDFISKAPSSFGVRYYLDASYGATGINATGSNTAAVVSPYGKVIYVKGFFRRYSTMNSSKMININASNAKGGIFASGDKLKADQRYEIDINSALGKDYLGRDLIVQLEGYNDGTGTDKGIIGWGRIPLASYIWVGAGCSVLNDKIVIQTGNSGLSGYGRETGHPFGFTSRVARTEMACRIKVWKVDQFLPKDTDAGGSKNAPYVTQRGGNAATGYYEKWSDGFIRQWGDLKTGNAVTFPVAFSNAESINIGVTAVMGNTGYTAVNRSSIKTTGFTHYGQGVAIHWTAQGY